MLALPRWATWKQFQIFKIVKFSVCLKIENQKFCKNKFLQVWKKQFTKTWQSKGEQALQDVTILRKNAIWGTPPNPYFLKNSVQYKSQLKRNILSPKKQFCMAFWQRYNVIFSKIPKKLLACHTKCNTQKSRRTAVWRYLVLAKVQAPFILHHSIAAEFIEVWGYPFSPFAVCYHRWGVPLAEIACAEGVAQGQEVRGTATQLCAPMGKKYIDNLSPHPKGQEKGWNWPLFSCVLK